jgi:hypothetical protein
MRHLNLYDEIPLGHIHVWSERESAARSLPFDYLQQPRWSSKFELIQIAEVDSCDFWQLVCDN